MAVQEILKKSHKQEMHIKELIEENDLLFQQLHIVQEELEKYYHKFKECDQKKGQPRIAESVVLDPRLFDVLAENQKLRTMVELQKQFLLVERENTTASRLGNMLITGVASTGSLLTLPSKLRKIWKALERTTPPAELGGKSFQKVIDAYDADGFEAVETLLESIFIAAPMRANAYTALARHLMPINAAKAAKIARLAYDVDPRPYRLKWLASRVYEAGDVVTAEAMLDMLPADIVMSNSEQRQAMRIHKESARQRQYYAEKELSITQQKVIEIKQPENSLSEVKEFKKRADEYKREVDDTRKQNMSLQIQIENAEKKLKKAQCELKATNMQLVSLLKNNLDLSEEYTEMTPRFLSIIRESAIVYNSIQQK